MVLYQDGEYSAFEELYYRHSGRIYAYLKAKVPNSGEAEELYQQVFLKLHQHRMGFNPTLPFLPWVFSITRNSVVDHFRKHKPTVMEQEKVIAIADRKESLVQEGTEALLQLEAVMTLLPEDQRKLINLRFQEGMSFEEIASLSGTNESAARKRVSRIIQNLRKALTGKGVRT